MAGLNIPPSQRFFNQPSASTLEDEYEIHADISFPEHERYYLKQAAKEFTYFSNDKILFNIQFDLDPDDQEMIDNQSVIIRADKYHPVVVEADGYHRTTALGLCQYRPVGSIIYMVHDRLSYPITYRTVAIHELGHFVGMDHTANPSIMGRYNYNDVLYPTYNDAVEFARVYQCSPEELRYFKL